MSIKYIKKTFDLTSVIYPNNCLVNFQYMAMKKISLNTTFCSNFIYRTHIRKLRQHLAKTKS